ncbi:MAG: hypothetical protein P0S93_02930 [Candidatus Neptunochlamydia sp.]|nr:hypothetical protein [Candidatus Neptunochlamydia sp.]
MTKDFTSNEENSESESIECKAKKASIDNSFVQPIGNILSGSSKSGLSYLHELEERQETYI